MYLFRVILIIAAIVLIVLIIRKLIGSSRPATRRVTDSGHMVQCAHCGIYIPESDSVPDGDRRFCTEAHKLAHRSK